MEHISKQKMAQYAMLILLGGVVLFICLNTNEAKKLFNFVTTVLSPFIYGLSFAYILNIIVKMFDKLFEKHFIKKNKPFNKKRYRIISIIISVLTFTLITGFAIGLIIPNLKSTIESLIKQAPELWEKLMDQLDKFKVKQPRLAEYITKFENNIDIYYEKLLASLKNNMSNIATTALSKIKNFSNIVLNGLLGIMIAFTILVKKEKLVKEFYAILNKILPKKHYTRAKYVLELANKKFQIFFKYNFIQAILTGGIMFVVMLVTALPYKLSLSLLIVVTQLFPIIGAIIGTIVGTILIAAVSPVKAVVFLVLFIIVQQIVEKLINPLFMGKELDLPGMLTFLVIVIAGKEFGLLGLICSVPFVSVLYDIYRQKFRPLIYSKGKE